MLTCVKLENENNRAEIQLLRSAYHSVEQPRSGFLMTLPTRAQKKNRAAEACLSAAASTGDDGNVPTTTSSEDQADTAERELAKA